MNKPFLLFLLLSTPFVVGHSSWQQRIARIVRAPERGQNFVSLDERTASAIRALAESEWAKILPAKNHWAICMMPAAKKIILPVLISALLCRRCSHALSKKVSMILSEICAIIQNHYSHLMLNQVT